MKKDDKGATVQLQYGLEAYAPARHLRTEDEKPINVEDVKEFMIIEFDRSEKRILVLIPAFGKKHRLKKNRLL